MPYEVIKRTENPDVKGLQMGDRHKHYFKNSNVFRLPDREAAQARDIKQKFGQDGSGDVLVAEVPGRTTGSQHYVSRVPWHTEE